MIEKLERIKAIAIKLLPMVPNEIRDQLFEICRLSNDVMYELYKEGNENA